MSSSTALSTSTKPEENKLSNEIFNNMRKKFIVGTA